GSHLRLYEKMGSHLITHEGVAGGYFLVWAPNARNVSVVGDFNGWNRTSHPLRPRGSAGIWAGFVGGIGQGTKYKYYIESQVGGYKVEKADPYAIHHETPPHTASIVWPADQTWSDAEWLAQRQARQALDKPMSIYEVHIGSWRRMPEDGDRSLSYREL